MSLVELAGLAPDKPVAMRLVHAHGSTDEFKCAHTLTDEQIEWFHAGSALSWIGQQG